MRKWRLRDSRPEDLEAMFEVWYTSVLATHDFVSESDFADICVLVRRDYLPHPGFTVAVDKDDWVIGFLKVERNEIDSLFIAPAYRGKGLGRVMFNDVIVGVGDYEAGRDAVDRRRHA